MQISHASTDTFECYFTFASDDVLGQWHVAKIYHAFVHALNVRFLNYPANIQRRYNVVTTSLQRPDVTARYNDIVATLCVCWV